MIDKRSFVIGAKSPLAASGGGGGGGTTDYNALSNKPSIGGVTLSGDKTAADLGLVTVESGAEANVIDSITVNGSAVSVTDKTAALTVPTKVSELTNDSDFQDAQQVASAIDTKISSAYKAGGSATIATLPALSAAKLGVVVNMLEDFTTTSDFLEGAGKTYSAGTNVVVALAGENVYKYDVLAGFVDLSGTQDKLGVTGASNRGVYVSAAGTVSAMEHTLDKDVPADAVFTDTVTEVDDTLSNAGQAADAKVAGDNITLLRELVNGIDVPIYRTAGPGNPVIFSDGAAANVKALSVGIAPAQSGEGDPYPPGGGRNLLPLTLDSIKQTAIGGTWANDNTYLLYGINFTVNLDDSGNITDITANGTATAGAYFKLMNALPLIEDEEYTLTGCPAGGGNATYGIYTGAYDTDNMVDIGAGNTKKYSSDKMTSLYIFIRGTVTVDNLVFRPMIRPASDTDATFAPYSNIRPVTGVDSVTVTRTDENGANSRSVTVQLVDSNDDPLTIGGGTLNVTTGELTVTWKRLDLGSISWTPRNYATYFTSETITDAPTPKSGGYDCLCDIYLANRTAVSTFMSSNYRLLCFADGISRTDKWLALRDTRYTTASELKEALSGHYLVYPLAAPVTYQLTPAQLATVSGYNTVSSDAGNVTIEYQSNYNNAIRITFTDIAAASPVPEQHRMVFGGRNLGTSVNAAQIAAIRNGTFDGLLVGDYWLINGVTWRIVDMDYWYGCGNTPFNSHHLVIMPDSGLTRAVMNETNTTTGGYTGSKMYTDTLPTVKTTCAAAFPDMILSHREYLVNAVTDGKPSGVAWVDSDVELPSEIMMYGGRIVSPGNDGATAASLYTINRSQLALFNLTPRFIRASALFWLRDPVSETSFAYVSGYGAANNYGASNSGGVRPVFPVG